MECINLEICLNSFMKISIGSNIIKGPYGGGNEFIRNLHERLIKDGHEVVFTLDDDDIDIILLTNPLKNSINSTFDNYDIDFYQKFKNPNSIAIQRINECDERKNTKSVNKELIKRNKNIDLNIFVSNWLKKIFIDQGIDNKGSIVLMGGPTIKLFNRREEQKKLIGDKIKIVTHHWSGNVMKGLNTYLLIDELLENKKLKDRYEFTYIGNLDEGVEFKNSKIIKPLYGIDLVKELKKHDIYITASINEPSGNHHMEAAMLGLPILYFNSGGTPEYCYGFGLEFNSENILQKIDEIVSNYDCFTTALKKYPYSFENAYVHLINFLNEAHQNKDKIIKNRNNLNNVAVILKFIYSFVMRYFYKKYINTKIYLGRIKRYAAKVN